MTIIKEKMPEENWTDLLFGLQIKEECLVAPLNKYNSLRTTATRLQKKNFTKYKFCRKSGVLKIWRKA